MHLGSRPSVRGASCLDIGFRHMFSALIIIIIISIFKEDNVFSITASLPYGPPVSTDIDYYRTSFFFGLFCKCCDVSCAIIVRRREASACLIMLSTKQGSHWYQF